MEEQQFVRQNSTGGKHRLGGISKRGNSPPIYSEWLCEPNERRRQYDQSDHGSNALGLGNHRA
jgi:hypothetical protein